MLFWQFSAFSDSTMPSALNQNFIYIGLVILGITEELFCLVSYKTKTENLVWCDTSIIPN